LLRVGVLAWLPVLAFLVHWELGLAFLGGWFAGDVIHVLADVVVSGVKRLRKRMRHEKRGSPGGRKRAAEELGQWW